MTGKQITARYINEKRTLVERSDMPGAAIPARQDNKDFRFLKKKGIRIGDYEPPRERGDVIREQRRRLAAGFRFRFEDSRGEHLFGTSEGDMLGWSEVAAAAQASLNIGNNATFDLVTETGAVSVTALEWFEVFDAMLQRRQKVFAASFKLMARKTIPKDFANEKHWS